MSIMPIQDSFSNLKPDLILSAVEREGFFPTGRFQQLNSLENRVYAVYIDPTDYCPLDQENRTIDRLVIKFYRPFRWTQDQILEEHRFLNDLKDAQVPVCCSLTLKNGSAIGTIGGYSYSLWPRSPGRIPDEFTPEMLSSVGRALALIHTVGESRLHIHRPRMDSRKMFLEPLEYLLDQGTIPGQFSDRFSIAAKTCANLMDERLAVLPFHRIHGDCHWGNLLHDGVSLRFLDFDDTLTGPAVQDIWMIAPAVDEIGIGQRLILLDAYRTVKPFDDQWLSAIDVLRVARGVYYSAWIARRWADPSFPKTFPLFGSNEYWEQETLDLENFLNDHDANRKKMQAEEIKEAATDRGKKTDAQDDDSSPEKQPTNKDFFWDWEERE
jgi:Ser/Thr protein kinase RdoA (MazF antagonist)